MKPRKLFWVKMRLFASGKTDEFMYEAYGAIEAANHAQRDVAGEVLGVREDATTVEDTVKP